MHRSTTQGSSRSVVVNWVVTYKCKHLDITIRICSMCTLTGDRPKVYTAIDNRVTMASTYTLVRGQVLSLKAKARVRRDRKAF